jgi:glutaminyl-tRNA synthetase
VVEVRCTYDPETRGGNAPDGRKVRGTIHWVSAAHAVAATVRLYEQLFTEEDPTVIEKAADLRDVLNPDSLQTLTGCMAEPSLANAVPGHRVQFERQGYFVVDPDSTPERPVFDRITTLRDTWAKIEKKMAP